MADEGGFTLHYITDSLWGTKTANNVAKMEMAEAFCRQQQVEKLYFYTLMENKEKLEQFYSAGYSAKIRVRPLFLRGYKDKTLYGRDFWSLCYDLFYASPIMILRAFWLALTFRKEDKVFIRGLESLLGFYFASLIKNPEYAFERHNYSFGKYKIVDFFFRRIIRKAKFAVTISEYTKDNWVNSWIAGDKIIVLPSGVNLEYFERITENKEQLREGLGLADSKKIITYCGGLYEHRGIEELLHCASKCGDYLFLFLGGTEEQIEKYQTYIRSRFQRQLPNVIFTGYVEHSKAALYFKTSDILAAPYSKNIKTVQHMSPVKLIEYLASKVPVVVSDLPAIRAILSQDEVTFCRPDDAAGLYEKIKLVLDNYGQAESKAVKAYEKAANLTWNKRAERIVALLRN
jgi:glycosyltransferase involved in cell wall biosynthesis